jgi:hypothetical protein
MSNQNHNSTYNYLFEKFGHETIRDRYAFLYETLTTFINDRKINEFVSIDEFSLESVIRDYFSDIARLKDFHNIDYVNTTKIAAYMVYWITKRKPLILSKTPTPEILLEKPYLQDINEWYCWYLVLGIMFDPRQYIHHPNWNKWNIFMNAFNYFLSYRIVSAQAIELALLGLLAEPIYPLLSDNNCSSTSA